MFSDPLFWFTQRSRRPSVRSCSASTVRIIVCSAGVSRAAAGDAKRKARAANAHKNRDVMTSL
jgi:hypothetical protein